MFILNTISSECRRRIEMAPFRNVYGLEPQAADKPEVLYCWYEVIFFP